MATGSEVSSQPGKLELLVCGKIGVGKSSLVNSLVGREVCKILDPVLSSFNIVQGTVNKTEVTINEVLVTIWDSPGLQDGTTKNNETYLQDMHTKCHNANLVLYCVDMSNPRWTYQDKIVAKLLTSKFGHKFWEKTILVMTRSNLVYIPECAKGGEFIYMKNLYKNISLRFRKLLRDQDVSNEIVDAIPAVAAGYVDLTVEDGSTSDSQFLWYVSKNRENIETSKQNFLPEIWVTCFVRTSGAVLDNFILATSPKRICMNTHIHDKEMQIVRAEREKLQMLQGHQPSSRHDTQCDIKDEQPQPLPIISIDDNHFNRMFDHLKKEFKWGDFGAALGGGIGQSVAQYVGFSSVPGHILGSNFGRGLGKLFEIWLKTPEKETQT